MRINMKAFHFIIFCFLLIGTLKAKSTSIEIPSNRLLTDQELIELVSESNDSMMLIKREYNNSAVNAVIMLAEYYKQFFAEHFYYDWRGLHEKFNSYKNLFPEKIMEHQRRTNEHTQLFSSNTRWKLPFKTLDGNEVTAYQLRHLARQHKAFDMALVNYYEDNRNNYIEYFINQVKSLNQNYFDNNVETGGNDVFEYFRSGYRIFNWLNIHNIYLSSEVYETEDQMLLIKTFLYHGAEMYKRTKKFNNGNHHTKGLMSLALLSIMFRDIKGTEIWLKHALDGLTRHLEEEVNEDGFQFERSIHYHKGDINNYFYVYYLAKLNGISLPEVYLTRFQSMFDALIKLAFPNKTLPVLQDDTDGPWSEFNNLSSVITLASILFNNPSYSYFMEEKVPSEYFWFLRDKDINKIETSNKKPPEFLSTSLPKTGYYIMRNGWNKNDMCMIISAGLSAKKPDHQHGDMLGLVAYANESNVLPNYQVRYYLNDYNFFKNSLVKNVAIVDSSLHGKKWIPNSGGSGFGKWKILPNPNTILWQSHSDYDVFIGTHDGYKNDGVSYFRKVIFIKDGFWIVKDLFEANSNHNFQQVWQGHYTLEDSSKSLRSTFANGCGLDILQLKHEDYYYDYGSFRGKGNVVVNSGLKNKFDYLTILYPFNNFEERFSGTGVDGKKIKEWSINAKFLDYQNDQIKIEGCDIINKSSTYFVFDCEKIKFASNELMFLSPADVTIRVNNGDIQVNMLTHQLLELRFSSIENVIVNGKQINELILRDVSPGTEIFIDRSKVK